MAGNDTISGGGGNDAINAGTGNDTVSGGPDNDAITPGGGLDVVVFAPGDGSDTVAGFDFNPTGGQDKLDITAFGITVGTFNGAVTRTDTGPSVQVTIVGTGVTFTLTGVASIASVDATDFVLS